MLKFLLIACIVVSAWSLELKTCKSNNKAKITHLNLSPDPVNLAADSVKISTNIALSSDVSQLEAQLTVKKKVGLIWVKVPCHAGIGSCKFDICAELTKAKFLHQCPLPAQTLNLNDREIKIPSLSSFVKFLITGKIRAKVEFKENGNVIACEEVTFNIENSKRRLGDEL